MKKVLNTILIGLIGIICSGCNQYFISDAGTPDNNVYYGAYNRRDFTWADVVMYQKGSNKYCEGVIHLNAPTRSITMKNDSADAIMKMACSDGTLININWQLKKRAFADGFGSGVDQYNKTYNFKTVPKSEFLEVADNPQVQIPDKDLLLKY